MQNKSLAMSEQTYGHYHHLAPAQAYQASKLGMWLFLATEVLFFGGLLCAFAVFHWAYFDLFHERSRELDWRLGALNTVVLLISSYFMALGVDAAQRGDNRKVAARLHGTIVLGIVFLIVKFVEYRTKFHHGFFPWTDLYFGLYFSLTGLHGIHVLVGIGALIWLRGLAGKQVFSTTYYTPVEVCGLYWHLVDLIWIYLFPLLYLIR